MGALSETVESIASLKEAFLRARKATRTYVISLKVDAYEGWTSEGHAWWEIGTPEVSERAEVRQARETVEQGRKKQRAGI